MRKLDTFFYFLFTSNNMSKIKIYRWKYYELIYIMCVWHLK